MSTASPTLERPWRILGPEQIAIATLDFATFEPFWVDALGLPEVHRVTMQSQNVDERTLRVGLGPNSIGLDLLRTLDPTEPAEGEPRKVMSYKNPNNHFGFWVDKFDAAITDLKERGIVFSTGIVTGATGFRSIFVHPKSTGKISFELIEAPPEIVALYDEMVHLEAAAAAGDVTLSEAHALRLGRAMLAATKRVQAAYAHH